MYGKSPLDLHSIIPPDVFHLLLICLPLYFHLAVPLNVEDNNDSLLASPIILDLVILTELCQRITFCTEQDQDFQTFHSVLSILSFLCKAPLVPQGTPVVNALFRQRNCIENILRACLGLYPQNHMMLEYKMQRSFASLKRPSKDLNPCPISSKKGMVQVNGFHQGITNGHCNGLKQTVTSSDTEIEN
ncbi:hypothetical protein AB205_0026330 [Aquarana catesbeiana]|uniref:Uncharacterized protein n=1 Tax=Aquarana catesbeiana TaxID=8400 RepID=A0A2G9SLD8_AQUCT|nr:hypothetical protein AB205_0026330 [Aquarana catesbeiana]